MQTNLQSNQAKKEAVVTEIKDKLGRAKSIVLVNARGLSVSQDTSLRKTLREAGDIDYKVYKNTMVIRSIEGTAFSGIKPHLAGPTAIAFSYEDATKAAAQIAGQMKAMPLLEFKGSCIDGIVYDAAQTKAIAEIPPREVLLSRLLGSLKSPMASVARLMQALADKNAEN